MKKLLCMVLALVLVIGMVGCSAKTDAPAAQEAPAAADATNAVVDVKEEPTGGIVRGGDLVVSKQKDFQVGLDITKDPDASSNYGALASIYESLLTIDEKGMAAPGLAESWEIAEDGLSITLKLRQDVSFHDGSKFNAEAAAKCMNFYVSEECGHVFKSSDLALITGAEVVDEYTVKINLSDIDSAIDLELAGTIGMMLSPASIDKGDYATNPVGTGPFALDKYVEGESVTLKANPNYYKMGEDGKPLPYLNSLKFVIMTDDATTITNLETGDIDGSDRLSSSTSVISAMNMDNITTYANPTCQVYNISCNLLYEPLNKSVRQAISYGVNAEEIVDVCMEGFGETSPFWTDPGKWFYYDYNPYTYDPDKARELMKEAGYENGLDLEIAVIAREPDNTIAQLLQSQLAEIGINLSINSMDANSWVAYVRNEHKEQLSVSLTGNVGYAPAKGWVIPLKAFGDVGTGLDVVDHLGDLMAQEKVTIDQDAKYEIVKEFQTTILDEAMATVLGRQYYYAAFNNNVHDVKFAYYGWLDFANAWMSE